MSTERTAHFSFIKDNADEPIKNHRVHMNENLDSIDDILSGLEGIEVYKPAGSTTFESLPYPQKERLGYVYNITNDFNTDARFVEGPGLKHKAGSNVVQVADGVFIDDDTYSSLYYVLFKKDASSETSATLAKLKFEAYTEDEETHHRAYVTIAMGTNQFEKYIIPDIDYPLSALPTEQFDLLDVNFKATAAKITIARYPERAFNFSVYKCEIAEMETPETTAFVDVVDMVTEDRNWLTVDVRICAGQTELEGDMYFIYDQTMPPELGHTYTLKDGDEEVWGTIRFTEVMPESIYAFDVLEGTTIRTWDDLPE